LDGYQEGSPIPAIQHTFRGNGLTCGNQFHVKQVNESRETTVVLSLSDQPTKLLEAQNTQHSSTTTRWTQTGNGVAV